MFFFITGILAIISLLWALWSLRALKKNGRMEKSIKDDLHKEKVVFHQAASSDSPSKSSESLSSLSD